MATSDRLEPFGVSVFSEMTALAAEFDAINLGQGYPNWPGVGFVKEAAMRSIQAGDTDQYPASAGVPELRSALADRYGPLLGRDLDPNREITVTSGCTEALAAAFLGLVNPGEEVVLIEPFFDAYPAGVALAGATPRYVQLRPPEFRLDPDELRSVFNDRTRAILINTPHNPTGRAFTRDELEAVADLCIEFDVIAITDEVYEDMTYDAEHHRLAAIPGMGERTLTLSSLGKTYSLTGWKVGWAIGPSALTEGLRAAHQFLTFTTPTPVQYGAVAALEADPSFYDDLKSSYRSKRDVLAAGLDRLGFDVHLPEGTYFLLAGFEEFGFDNDREFARHLVEKARVAVIPPSAFYHHPEDGRSLIRFAFCKDEKTLKEAIDRLGDALG